MRISRFFGLICICLLSAITIAQENKSTLPDLYTAEQTFFDPTRKTQQEEYHFATPWRLELGYAQLDHRAQDASTLYMHGVRLGATVDFLLPKNFSVQTGALLTLTYGLNNQHWASVTPEDAQVNILQHNLIQIQLTIPVRAYYNVKVWKKLNMFLYAGPQLHIGLTNYDILKAQVSPSTLNWLEQQGIPTTEHDRYVTEELSRANIQFGLGGGFEWDCYRLQAGYDFGLNNILRTVRVTSQKLNEWGWYVSFSYKL